MNKLIFLLFLPLYIFGVPNSPLDLTLTPSSNKITLSWQDNSMDESGFKIFRDGIFLSKVGAGVTTYTDYQLTENTNYIYEIKATDDGENLINSVGVTKKGDKISFSLYGEFSEQSHVYFLIDSDNNPDTGYSLGTIKGADYLIEDSKLYRYPVGVNGWNWDKVSEDVSYIRTQNSSTSTLMLDLLAPTTTTIKYFAKSVTSNFGSKTSYKDMESFSTLDYGQLGRHSVRSRSYADDFKSILYFPSDRDINKPTPVIFFVPGWSTVDLDINGEYGPSRYKSLIGFMVSKGYTVLYAPSNKKNNSKDVEQYVKSVIDTIEKSEDGRWINTSKVGVVGHSSGAGNGFYVMKELIKKGWGKDGRFIMAFGPWFSFGMSENDFRSYPSDLKVVIQKFNNHQITDSRIPLTEFYLLNSIPNIYKSYQVDKNLKHSYVRGEKSVAQMQFALKPLDALIDFTFNHNLDARSLAFSGGGVDPMGDLTEEIRKKEDYLESCSNSSPTKIDYCKIFDINNILK